MSSYYILIHDPPWAGPVAKRINGVRTDLSRGRLVDISEPFDYLLQVDKKATDSKSFPPLDFHRVSGQCLFSKKFQNALTIAGVTNIQYFPAKVIYEPTKIEHEYKVANIIGVVKALDTEASKCSIDKDGFVYDFELMVFDEKKLTSDVNFSRLYEMLSIIVISERVANILNQFNLSGLSILKPSNWEPGMI